MPFCPNCGEEYTQEAKFCVSCGKELPTKQQAIEPKQPVSEEQQIPSALKQPDGVVKEHISQTSRLSRLGLEKFLMPDERILYNTIGQVWFGNQKRRAYVTNKRLILYYRQDAFLGLGLIKNDKLDEINLRMVRKVSLVEKGVIAKNVTLHLDENIIKGDRGDIVNLYNTIQSVRGS